ncbi:MAG: non-ribosomal peptide synthetase, partial [Myxococcota bacterium]
QLASPSFDVIVIEVWVALLCGARVVLPPPGPMSLQELGESLVEHKVTYLHLTPVLFNQMVDHQLKSMTGLRTLVSGGDAVSVSHATRALGSLPDVNVVCSYGPTENAVTTTCHRFAADDPVHYNAPIGRPLDNTQVYVLDRNLEPVPEGVIGELYAAGPGLAHGYLKRPALTAECFVPNPFSDLPGARMYRTGDLVRWRHNGVLDFVERRDAQVKVRGFRIELGEIEHCLANHPHVTACAAIVRPDPGGIKRVLAYATIGTDSEVSGLELRDYIRERLPGFMVPAAVRVMDEMPLLPSGKLDRRALPDPEGSDMVTATEYRPPSNADEERMANLWAELLSLERVGVNDDFFALGGHSL